MYNLFDFLILFEFDREIHLQILHTVTIIIP